MKKTSKYLLLLFLVLQNLITPIKTLKQCYNKNHEIIYPKSENQLKKCVYTTLGFTKLFDPKTLTMKKTDNEDCEAEDICLATCYKNKCFSIGFGIDTIELKKSWLIKSIAVFGIYIGFGIGFLLILFINQKFELKNFRDNIERSVILEKGSKDNSVISYFIEDPDDEISERFTDKNILLEIEDMINNNKKNYLKNNYILSKSKSFK